jgi:DNA-binding transcriptional MerR regulator
LENLVYNGAIFLTGGQKMARTTNISPEAIRRFQKRLRSLPVKKTGKSLEAAMELLTEDVRKALEKKGYKLKEIRAMLVEDGIPIPASMLKRHLAGEQKISQKIPRKKIALVETDVEIHSAEGITIKPDTPDEEL